MLRDEADDNPVYTDFGDVLLLNQRMVYVQPVNNNLHAPLPGPSLEVLFKIGFDYSLPAG